MKNDIIATINTYDDNINTIITTVDDQLGSTFTTGINNADDI